MGSKMEEDIAAGLAVLIRITVSVSLVEKNWKKFPIGGVQITFPSNTRSNISLKSNQINQSINQIKN